MFYLNVSKTFQAKLQNRIETEKPEDTKMDEYGVLRLVVLQFNG